MMTTEEKRKYIQEQRAAGVSDDNILSAISVSEQPKPERGFAGELVPTAFSIGGGILGGIGGAAAGGIGAIPGGIAGAGIGGALGETIQQGIEKSFQQRDKMDPGQIAATGVIDAGLQATGGLFGKYVARPLYQAAKPTVVKFLSKMSGYADDVLHAALQRTPGAVTAVQQGEAALVDVVKKTAAGISTFAKNTVKENSDKIAQFTKQSVSGALPGTKQALLNESKNFGQSVITSLRSKFKIGVDTKTGQLLFDRAKNMSNIVSTADRGAIQSAFDTIQTIAKNPDIRHIDSVLERLITLRSKTPVGAPTGAETRAIISEMSDSVIDWVKSIPAGYGKGYAAYVEHLQTALPKRIMINDAKELFGSSANLSPKEVSQIEKRLLQLYNTGNLATREFAGEVGKTVGTDVTGTAAGTLMKTGDQMSVRAPNLTVRGTAQKMLEYIPRAVVKEFVATGNLIGEFAPSIKIVAKILGTTEKALIVEMANLMSNKETE